MLLLIIVLVLLFGGGAATTGIRGGGRAEMGIVGTILLIVLLLPIWRIAHIKEAKMKSRPKCAKADSRSCLFRSESSPGKR